MGQKFYITGIPGSGKSTIVKKLQENNFPAFDIEELEGFCYWRHKETFERVDYHSGVDKGWLDAHEWVSDIEKLKKFIEDHPGILIIGGIIANQNEYLPFFDKTVLLQCGEDVFIERLKARTGKDEYGKTSTERESILESYREFENGLIVGGAIPVSTEGTVDEAAGKIISIITDRSS
jgi:broad-specificity NMP kinase